MALRRGRHARLATRSGREADERRPALERKGNFGSPLFRSKASHSAMTVRGLDSRSAGSWVPSGSCAFQESPATSAVAMMPPPSFGGGGGGAIPSEPSQF